MTLNIYRLLVYVLQTSISNQGNSYISKIRNILCMNRRENTSFIKAILQLIIASLAIIITHLNCIVNTAWHFHIRYFGSCMQ